MKKIERKTYIIDVNEKVLGRVSTRVANILRGKEKVNFAPNQDLGDNVVIVNAKGVKLTGNKIETKKYYRHEPRRPGSMKIETAKNLIVTNPSKILFHSIYRMLPKNKLQDVFIKKLQVFNDDSYKIKDTDIKLEV